MRKIDIEQAPTRFGTMYPEPYDVPCRHRKRWRLGAAAGLTGFGVNLCRLPPGTWSSQRHWHSNDDEFIYVVDGEVVLVTDVGDEMLKAGDCVGFKAGEADGHHLQNRSDHEALVLEVGTNTPAASQSTRTSMSAAIVSDGKKASFGHAFRWSGGVVHRPS